MNMMHIIAKSYNDNKKSNFTYPHHIIDSHVNETTKLLNSSDYKEQFNQYFKKGLNNAYKCVSINNELEPLSMGHRHVAYYFYNDNLRSSSEEIQMSNFDDKCKAYEKWISYYNANNVIKLRVINNYSDYHGIFGKKAIRVKVRKELDVLNHNDILFENRCKLIYGKYFNDNGFIKKQINKTGYIVDKAEKGYKSSLCDIVHDYVKTCNDDKRQLKYVERITTNGKICTAEVL